MDNAARDYLRIELDHFQKNAETQFTHFMGVFYFWTAVVTAPVTAGLAKRDEIDPEALGSLLFLIAVLGGFLAAKMFDIRCSQLRYLVYLNRIRSKLFEHAKKVNAREKLFTNYDHPFPPAEDLRKGAKSDFGM